MKNHGLLLIISYYCLVIGAVNLLMWAFILISGNVEDFEEKSIQYTFHWISEFSTAILLILAGFKLFKDKENLNFLFLALGFLITAVGGAFIYYLGNFDVPMFIMTTLITGSTIIILILIYENLNQLLFFTNGIALYSLLNIMGRALQEMDISLISMSVPAFLFVFIITLNLVNKNVVFRYKIHVKGNKEDAENNQGTPGQKESIDDNISSS